MKIKGLLSIFLIPIYCLNVVKADDYDYIYPDNSQYKIESFRNHNSEYKFPPLMQEYGSNPFYKRGQSKQYPKISPPPSPQKSVPPRTYYPYYSPYNPYYSYPPQ